MTSSGPCASTDSTGPSSLSRGEPVAGSIMRPKFAFYRFGIDGRAVVKVSTSST